MMDAAVLDSRQRGYLKTIRTSGEMLLTVVSDILDISKIEAGQLALRCKPFSLREAITQVGDSAWAFQTNFGYTQVQVEVVDATMPECDWIVGDPVRVIQVLQNCLLNAIKFTKDEADGLVQYGVRLRQAEDNQRSFLEFHIADSGIGIPEENQSLIFEAFHQVHPSRDSHELGGTGLGLTISKRLVEMMGGEMWLDSNTTGPNRGTRVYFTIPYQPAEKDVSKQESAPHASKVVSIADSTPLNITMLSSPVEALTKRQRPEGEANPLKKQTPRPSSPTASPTSSTRSNDEAGSEVEVQDPLLCNKILVVDDNRINLKLAVRMVNCMGYETVTAMNGKEAVAMFQSNPSIRLILMDKEMPIMDGLQAVQEIRRIEK